MKLTASADCLPCSRLYYCPLKANNQSPFCTLTGYQACCVAIRTTSKGLFGISPSRYSPNGYLRSRLAHYTQEPNNQSPFCKLSEYQLQRSNPHYVQRTLWYFTSRHSSNGCCTAAWLVVRKNKPFNILFLSVIFQYSVYPAICLC